MICHICFSKKAHMTLQAVDICSSVAAFDGFSHFHRSAFARRCITRRPLATAAILWPSCPMQPKAPNRGYHLLVQILQHLRISSIWKTEVRHEACSISGSSSKGLLGDHRLAPTHAKRFALHHGRLLGISPRRHHRQSTAPNC